MRNLDHDSLEAPSNPAVAAALKAQYHAALAMLRDAIEKCPDGLWTESGGGHANPFWHIAYHALFYTHFYLQQDENSFTPWEHHRNEYQFLGSLPWPPHEKPKIGEPYSKAQILEYQACCEEAVDDAVDAMDLTAPECGFPWYPIPKLEHQIVNIRHIQHHAAQLADRLRPAIGAGVDWVGSGGGRD